MGKTFDPDKPDDYLAELQDQEGDVSEDALLLVVPANAGTHTPRAVAVAEAFDVVPK